VKERQRKNRSEYDRRICKAIDYIHLHFKEEMSIDEVAKSAAFSKFHFQRLFRALTGESVGEFVRRFRLETAARRLKTPSYQADITSLALELGFSSSQNFAKIFKSHYGMTPSEYRDSSNQTVVDNNQRTRYDGSGEPEGDELNVIVTQLPSVTVAYKRHFGAYASRGLEKTFDELTNWALANSIGNEACYLGIPWDDISVTDDKRCRFDCCIVIAEQMNPLRGINTQIIPAGTYAILRREVLQNNFEQPWDELMSGWLPASGLVPDDRPRFEKYLSDGSRDPSGRWLLECCLPVKSL
jgi:AraC family transcriptional regulator